MTRRLLLLVAFFTCFFTNAQEGSVRGKATVAVLNESSAAVEGATVTLMRSRDSLLVRSAVTDKNGIAEIENIESGKFFLKATMVGYTEHFSAHFEVSRDRPLITIPSLTLVQKAVGQLEGVTVTGRKPFLQKLADRIVVNVDNSIVSAGSTALDIIERSPGITLDQNDAISLRGRSGVVIMIDGKPSPMSGADLANYLRGLPANAIESIHIITNPSAKYEAAGNSGIIDIRMKKDQRLGANGTFTAGYGQGVFPKANAGTTFNYRNKKWNLFGNYNYDYREHLNHLIINRNFFTRGVRTGSDDKDNYSRFPTNAHSLRIGADFFPSKNTIIGFVVNNNFRRSLRTSENETIKNDVVGKPISKFFSDGSNRDRNRNAVANANIKHTFKGGRELTADLDYGRFRSTSITRTATGFYDLSGSPISANDILDGDQRGSLKLRAFKMDYMQPIKAGGKVEAGFRTSYVSSDNNAIFMDGVRNLLDTGKTNHFFYHEYNSAGYVNWSREMKKWSVQFGLRGEQTDLRTRQEKGDTRFNRSYFELFPSAFINYKIKEDRTVGLSVSRRIDRPGYSQLNPFLYQIDATIFSTGAPLLQPQMTWSYEMNYTVKTLFFTLGYSRTDRPQSMVLSPILDVIPNFVIEPGKDSNITVQIPVNLESSDNLGLSATLPFKPRSWWNMVNNVNVYYSHTNGNLAGVAISNGGPAGSFRSNNTFTFKKGWGAELNGTLFTGGRSGYSFSQPQWGIAAGGQKTVLKGQGTVRLNVTDIFWTNLPRSTITYEGKYVENWHAYRETRVANLSFVYRFGSNKVQAARRRSAAAEEEVRRAGGS